MSRTIRRTSDKARYPRFEKQYTHAHPDTWRGMTLDRDTQGGFPLLPLEGMAFQRAYFRYYSDNGLPSFGFENAFERPMAVLSGVRRRRVKHELHKWLKDPDYEVQDLRDKQIWDLC
jgi:hypothetical protein